MDFFQNTCLKENDNNGGCKNLTVTTNFENGMEQKLSSKQVASITCTLEKNIFAAATFEGLWVV